MTDLSSLDVLVVGAGLSGINSIYRLTTALPHLKTAAVDARHNFGGTWDLFKYPGLRSDSDLYSFAFEWNPWISDHSIAPANEIMNYVHESIDKFDLARFFVFGVRVRAINWSSKDLRWYVSIERELPDGGTEETTISTRFIVFSSGYYSYEKGLEASIPGLSSFTGTTIHPQFWPEDYDYTNKKVAIIGSGATAITLLPSMAPTAGKVTMVQRSPTYVLSLPASTPFSWLRYLIGSRLLSRLRRRMFILLTSLLYVLSRTFPRTMRLILTTLVSLQLPSRIPLNPHFLPRYNPWDQRLCIAPGGDFFRALRSGKADVVTGTIDTVTPTGINMKDGTKVPADTIITATGLKLQFYGGVKVSIDGVPVDPGRKFLWRGCMLQDVPNAFSAFGYVFASWTLGADAAIQTAVRLLSTMPRKHASAVIPRITETPDTQRAVEVETFNLNSSYVLANRSLVPRSLSQGPFQQRKGYAKDIKFAQYGDLQDGMEFVRV